VGLTRDDYRAQLQALLPQGAAWTRESDAALTGLLDGLAEELARVDARGDVLMAETDPRAVVETLSDWERAWGLPDGCVTAEPTEAGRRLALHQRVAGLGGQSASYYIGMAALLGYETEIDAFGPSRVPFSLAAPLADLPWAYAWRVSIYGPLDPAGPPLYASADLDCVISRLRPAHTVVTFDYEPDPEPTFFFDFIAPPD
jgi:uncharacterized protein YmfQ (DUF2313 family)